jgi:hypothetical protein
MIAENPPRTDTPKSPIRFGKPGIKGGRIEIPVTISLNEQAADTLVHQQKRPSTLFANEFGGELGFSCESVGPAALQSMIRRHYIGRIEVAFVDADAQSGPLVDLIKAISFGFLYMKFNTDTQETIFRSEIIRRWNRANPSKIIDRKTRFNATLVNDYLRDHDEEITLLIDTIVEPVIARLEADPQPIHPDPKAISHLCRHLAAMVAPQVWYVMQTLCGGLEDRVLVGTLQQHLYAFVQGSSMTNALASLILELLSNAAKTNLLDRARMLYGGDISMEKVLDDESMRARVIAEMAEHGEFLHLVFKTDTRGSLQEQRNRMVISLFNKENEFDLYQESTSMRTSMRAGNLRTYLRHEKLGSDFRTAASGHLAALEERCKSMNISVDTIVHNLQQLDFAIMNLTLLF